MDSRMRFDLDFPPKANEKSRATKSSGVAVCAEVCHGSLSDRSRALPRQRPSRPTLTPHLPLRQRSLRPTLCPPPRFHSVLKKIISLIFMASTAMPVNVLVPTGPKAIAITFGRGGHGPASGPTETLDADGRLSATMLHLRAEQRAFNQDIGFSTTRVATTRRDHPASRRGSHSASRQGGAPGQVISVGVNPTSVYTVAPRSRTT